MDMGWGTESFILVEEYIPKFGIYHTYELFHHAIPPNIDILSGNSYFLLL